MTFEEIPHTADILIRVSARTLAEIFSESATALMTVMYGNPGNGHETREIAVSADDISLLLVYFLSELLFVSESERLVFSTCTVKLTGTSLVANLTGERFDPERHGGGTEVKGISYSGVAIERNPGGYQVDILFDV
jgi:SHS2 domain-containing protein